MLLPDKMVKFKDSVLANFVSVMTVLRENQTISAIQLYKKAKCFDTITDFIQTLDALFALGEIELNEKGEIVCLHNFKVKYLEKTVNKDKQSSFIKA